MDYIVSKRKELNASGPYSDSIYLIQSKLRISGTLVPSYFMNSNGQLEVSNVRYNAAYWILLQKIGNGSDGNSFMWVKSAENQFIKLDANRVYLGSQLSSSFNTQTKQFFDVVKWVRPDKTPLSASIQYKFKLVGVNQIEGRLSRSNEISMATVDVTEEFLRTVAEQGIPHKFSMAPYREKILRNVNGVDELGGASTKHVNIEIISSSFTVCWSNPLRTTNTVNMGELVTWPE